MIDLYIKRIVIHQFTPNDTELILSDQLLTITPRIDEYFRKKLSKVSQMKLNVECLQKIMSFLAI